MTGCVCCLSAQCLEGSASRFLLLPRWHCFYAFLGSYFIFITSQCCLTVLMYWKFFFFLLSLLDEICGVNPQQQHNRWPLSGVCESKGPPAPGHHLGPAQSAYRLPHLSSLPSCSWSLQIYIGKDNTFSFPEVIIALSWKFMQASGFLLLTQNVSDWKLLLHCARLSDKAVTMGMLYL